MINNIHFIKFFNIYFSQRFLSSFRYCPFYIFYHIIPLISSNFSYYLLTSCSTSVNILTDRLDTACKSRRKESVVSTLFFSLRNSDRLDAGIKNQYSVSDRFTI